MSEIAKEEYIFLLGAGRSGTKFLRSVLASSQHVLAIPYDIGYVWRYGNEKVEHDEITVEMLNEKIRGYIQKVIPTLVDGKRDDATQFIVEKSVPNTLRPGFIHQVFPNAKFVHLIRDGRAVTESSMRMWKEPPNKSYLLKKIKYFPWSNYRYALWYMGNIVKGIFSSGRGQKVWGPRYKGIDNDVESLPLEVVCARQWKKCVEVATQQLSEVPASQVFEIRYEELMQDGESVLSELCDFIGIKDKQAVVSYYNKHVMKSNNKSWAKRLSNEEMDRINEEIGETLMQLGYGENL